MESNNTVELNSTNMADNNRKSSPLPIDFTSALVEAIETGVKAGIKAAYSDREKPLLSGREAAVLTNRCAKSKWYVLNQEGQVPAPVKGTNPHKWCRKELLKWAASGCPNRLEWENMRKEMEM